VSRIGDPDVLISFLKAQYAGAPFVANAPAAGQSVSPPPDFPTWDNDEITLVFAKNIVSYFNASQQALIPQ
jgi:hypothetical protein